MKVYWYRDRRKRSVFGSYSEFKRDMMCDQCYGTEKGECADEYELQTKYDGTMLCDEFIEHRRQNENK